MHFKLDGGWVKAVDGVSFDIAAGEFEGIQRGEVASLRTLRISIGNFKNAAGNYFYTKRIFRIFSRTGTLSGHSGEISEPEKISFPRSYLRPLG